MWTEMYTKIEGNTSSYKPITEADKIQGMQNCNCNLITCYYCMHDKTDKHGYIITTKTLKDKISLYGVK